MPSRAVLSRNIRIVSKNLVSKDVSSNELYTDLQISQGSGKFLPYTMQTENFLFLQYPLTPVLKNFLFHFHISAIAKIRKLELFRALFQINTTIISTIIIISF